MPYFLIMAATLVWCLAIVIPSPSQNMTQLEWVWLLSGLMGLIVGGSFAWIIAGICADLKELRTNLAKFQELCKSMTRS
jgi:hypothetical protein